MRALTALKTASAVAFTVGCLPLATPTSASSCADVHIIFARGSGQPLYAAEATSFRTEITRQLNAKKSGLSLSFYELGTEEHGGEKYPAVELNFWNSIGAKVSSGAAFSYGKSVKQGSTELKAYLKEYHAACPSTKFILGGYSQGAQVLTSSLPDLDAKNIIYAATFGDPKLYLPEGEGLVPEACSGKNLSNYRLYAPNCHTAAGSLGAEKPYQPSAWVDKLGLWCENADLICGAGIKVKTSYDLDSSFTSQIVNTATSAHTSYASNGIIASAAETIAGKIAAVFPGRVVKPEELATNRDTVILVDSSLSNPSVGIYYDFARKFTWSALYNDTSRVALYSYGDGTTKLLSDFGAPYSTFEKQLYSITNTPYSTGGELSAIKTVMDQQNWHVGAAKSIILLTDKDYSGGTSTEAIAAVVKRSLEIDPVNIYTVTPESVASSYSTLTDLTGGGTFTVGNRTDLSALLLSRPSATFPLSTYEATPGEKITFAADTSGDIVSYKWDLDFDGVFETKTSGPTVSKVYPSDTSGFVQLKITDEKGYSSTASAAVSVTADNNYRTVYLSDLVDLSAFFGATTEAEQGSTAEQSNAVEPAPGYGAATTTEAAAETVATATEAITNQAVETTKPAAQQAAPRILAPNSGRR